MKPLYMAVLAALLAPSAYAQQLVPNLRYTSDDGENSIGVHGRFVGDAGTGAGQGDAIFRRARLGLNGKFLKDFYFKFENDYARGNLGHGTTDAYVGYYFTPDLSLKAGQFKAPFSFETLTSSRFATFMERGLTTAFVPGRRLGTMLRANGAWDEQYWTAALGVFDGATGTARLDEDTQDVTGRVSYAPVAVPGHVLHVGFAGSYRTPDNKADSISYSSDPESSFGKGAGVDTGSITDVDHAMHYGLEAAGIWGPFSLQAEAIQTEVARSSGFADASFHAYYLQASYFLTGEHRNYVKSRGTFNRIEPKDPVAESGIGAWQVAGRYSAIDLTDAGIRGGQMQDITLGLNWFPHRQLAVMGNVVFVNSDASAPQPNDDPTLFMMRLQYDF